METTLEYMARMNKVLANDYKAGNGGNKQHCCEVAREVEKRLLAEGKQPRMYFVHSILQTDNWKEKHIIPKVYGGRVNDWFVHAVAVADSQVFDPMLGVPVSLDDYCGLAFEGKTEILPWKLD